MRCRTKTKNIPPMFPMDVEDLHFYEGIIKKTLCLLKCRKQLFKDKFIFTSPIIDKMYAVLKPYEYLQVCYYQQKQVQKAASAAFTFLVANPGHEMMIKNLKFYTDLPEVDPKKIENLEAKKFVLLYMNGIEAYNNENYAAAISNLEDSIIEWLNSAEECRANCEAPFDQGWLPDFTSSVANHFTFCLRCKNNCEHTLNSLNGEYYDDLLPSHYHYLQFSYYKVGELLKACRAAESYLLFFPEDKTMFNNRKFYLNELEETKASCTPRDEAVKYVHRMQYEGMLLKYIDSEFRALDKNTASEKGDVNHSTRADELRSVWNHDFGHKTYMIEGRVDK